MILLTKITLTFTLIMWLCAPSQAQKYYSKTAQVSFYSSTPVEKFDAQSSSGNCVMDMETGKVEFAVLVKSLKFKKALMEEHFNENYMDSHKYPKAIFKGHISDHDKISLTSSYNGKHMAKGDLTIRGVTRPVEVEVAFIVSNGKLSASTDFNITVADFDIKIPSVVRENVAKEVDIKVSADLLKL